MIDNDSNFNRDSLSESQALLILNALPTIGPIACKHLLNGFSGDAKKIFTADRNKLRGVKGLRYEGVEKILTWKKYFDLNKEESFMKDRSISFYSVCNKNYPKVLKEIYDPPIGLYCLGRTELFELPAIAIVGTRLASLYGKNQARKLAANLAKLGFCIVSGLARGIDFEAHRGALEVGGSSIAVLGHGLDIIYPPEHQDLYKSLEKKGLIVSEFPLGRKANRQSFPMRNRIIAGLSQGTIVVESGAKGGSLITANLALDFGRAVFAIPGRLDSPQSQGCLELIKDGATMLTSVKDVILELKHFQNIQSINLESSVGENRALSDSERELLSVFIDGSRFTPNAVAEHLNKDISSINASLIQLELKQCIQKAVDGCYEINNT